MKVSNECTYASVGTGEGDKRAGSAVSTVNNVDLGAAKVELSSTVALSNVEGNLEEHKLESTHLYCRITKLCESYLFATNEVLAAGCLGGNGEGEGLLGFE